MVQYHIIYDITRPLVCDRRVQQVMSQIRWSPRQYAARKYRAWLCSGTYTPEQKKRKWAKEIFIYTFAHNLRMNAPKMLPITFKDRSVVQACEIPKG